MIEVVTKTINEKGTYIFFIIPEITNHNLKKITKTVDAFQYSYFPDFIYLTDNSFSDVPQVPRNFTGYSYADGFINLTWVSGFNGGNPQYFIRYGVGGSGQLV